MKNFKNLLFLSVFVFGAAMYAQAQSPGGIAGGLQLWLPAQNYTGGTTWTDASGNGRNATKTGTITNTVLYNYNPVPAGFNNSNYFSVPHNTALDANSGAISVFAVGLPTASTYGVFAAKTSDGSWTAGWILATSSPNTDAGFTTGDWTGTGSTNVAKQSGFPTTVPYIINGFGSGAATNVVSVSDNGSTETTNTSTKTTSATRLTVGYDGYGNSPFNGNIGEVIMYNTSLNPADKLKVQSYLAIKFGLSLNSTGSPNYVNSAGNNIWTGTSHSGYQNNIFGIARDNASNLYQKQSKSTTEGSISAYLSTLTTTNATNTGTMNDRDAIMFGDNNLTGNTAYYYAIGTAFANGSLTSVINIRSAKIWNVQVTNAGVAGGSYTLNIATPGYINAKYVLVSSSGSFTPASTRIYSVSGGAASGVLMNNGDFVTIASMQASPGGVLNTNVAWFAANLSGNTIGSAATQWNDLSPNPYTLRATGTVTLNAGDAAHNFNPYFNGFSAANYFRAYDISDAPSQTNGFTKIAKGYSYPSPGGLDAGQFSVFSAARPTSAVSGSITGIDNDVSYAAEPGFNVTATLQPAMYGFSAGINSNTAATLTLNKTSVLSYLPKYTSGANGFMANIDGVASGTTMATSTATAGSNFQIGNDAYRAGFFGGDIQEVIWYKSMLNATDVNKIESYLAIKYGTTITAGTATNYVNSSGTAVWTGDAAYQRNIGGISRDDVSYLYQKQSNSVNANTNGQVVIGLGTIAATNIANTSTFNNDGVALIWGDNGNTTAMSNTAGTYTQFTYNNATNNRRMNRIWKVQNTGVNQAVNIRFPVASVGTTTLTGEGGCAKYVIIYSIDASFGNGNDSSAVLAVSGSNYTVNRKFPQGTSYFTFARLNEAAPGNVYLPAANTTMNVTDACLKGGWKYYYYDVAKAQKAFAINWNGNTEPGGMNGVLTYSATPYSVTSGGYTCNIMGRLLEILPAGGNYTVNGGVKVRVFFDSTELNNSLANPTLSRRWFKYPGNASAVQAANTGQAVAGATLITPAAAGEEDGIDYVEFNGIQSFSTFGFASNTGTVPLPVELLSFNGSAAGDVARLTWTTANSRNMERFVITYSKDGKSWSDAGTVSAHNSAGVSSYSFNYAGLASGNNYFRLKMVAAGGGDAYSGMINIRSGNAGRNDFTVYPNPVADNLVLTITSGYSGRVNIQVSDAVGRVIMSQAQQVAEGVNLQIIPVAHLTSGTYIVKIFTAEGGIIGSPRKIVKE